MHAFSVDLFSDILGNLCVGSRPRREKRRDPQDRASRCSSMRAPVAGHAAAHPSDPDRRRHRQELRVAPGRRGARPRFGTPRPASSSCAHASGQDHRLPEEPASRAPFEGARRATSRCRPASARLEGSRDSHSSRTSAIARRVLPRDHRLRNPASQRRGSGQEGLHRRSPRDVVEYDNGGSIFVALLRTK